MNQEKQIAKGFNAGYLLAQHRPELAKQLQASLKDNQTPYGQGFMAGAQEKEKENSKTKSAYQPKVYRKPSTKSTDKGRKGPER